MAKKSATKSPATKPTPSAKVKAAPSKAAANAGRPKQPKKADSVAKELRAAVKALQTQLAAAEQKADQWKDKARKHKSARASLEKQLASQAKAAAKTARQAVAVVTGVEAIAAEPTAPAKKAAPRKATARKTTPRKAAASVPEGTPSASWTVAQLRAAAAAKGQTGISRKTKAQLLSDLG